MWNTIYLNEKSKEKNVTLDIFLRNKSEFFLLLRKKSKMPPITTQKQQNWCLNMIWLVTLVAISGEYLVKGDSSPIPHLCDNVKCPTLSELSCPADSSIRELIAEPLIAVDDEEELLYNSNNRTEITEEIFSQCCLNKKCICNLCHIPDCHDDNEVVVELLPESIDMPGFCCGKYECQMEPNCTEVQNTENYWLSNCQRCKCYGGHKMCHQICDEGIKKPAMCHSKNLNSFYEHGQRWRDGCSDCECVNGEANCLITFCKGLNCPKNRQVQLKDKCCPVCWPNGFAMPTAEEEYGEDGDLEEHNDNEIELDHHYDNNEDYNENEDQDQEQEPDIELKPINDLPKATTMESSTTSTTAATTISSTTTTTTSTTTVKPTKAETTTSTTSKPVELLHSTATTPATVTNTPCKTEQLASTSTSSSTTPEPCNRQEVPATYQVYPQVVELMRYSQHNNLLYTIIGCLSVIVVILAAWNIHLKAKQRSYRPVSNFDDNFNRMTSNIKKTNDYV
ncbi:Cysteine-rich motor neuron 1 protein [Lucilia cuprina]|nr:Cysteine-rich motor neuron 1 protein [Lucilia cuprina]